MTGDTRELRSTILVPDSPCGVPLWGSVRQIEAFRENCSEHVTSCCPRDARAVDFRPRLAACAHGRLTLKAKVTPKPGVVEKDKEIGIQSSNGCAAVFLNFVKNCVVLLDLVQLRSSIRHRAPCSGTVSSFSLVQLAALPLTVCITFIKIKPRGHSAYPEKSSVCLSNKLTTTGTSVSVINVQWDAGWCLSGAEL